MAVDTPSMFSQVIQEHLELKRRNSALEHEMPLEQYLIDDPFENHPLFKTEEQARFEDTMDGVQGIEAEETHTRLADDGRHVHRTQPAVDPDATVEAVLPDATRSRPAVGREPLDALARLRLGRLAPARSQGFHGLRHDSRAQRLSSIRFTGQNVAEPPKSSAPAANTFAPAGVS